MGPWKLRGVGHEHDIEIPAGLVIVVGRAAESDVLIPDVTVSRRHARLEPSDHGLEVRDLASSNGTSVNGARIDSAVLVPGDTVSFGKVSYRLLPPDGKPVADPADPGLAGTVVRRIDLGAGVEALADAPAISANAQAHQLARVLDLAKRLSGELELDKLITAVVELTFDLLTVDRVSLLLLDDASGELVPALSKSRVGEAAGMRVPRSIARRAVADLAPILTENAVADERFRSGSVMLQSVRAAICTPLLASRDRVLGVLYVDTLTADRPFREDEATMLFAFGGLAAVALGKIRYAEEVRREAEVRANFERFFAPGVAARIARQRGEIRLGGERLAATIMFADIRGFTPIAETLSPDALGSLLTQYFTEMVEAVFEHGGTLDKFIGDAVMAVWGAPIQAPDDTDRAVAAALAMQERLERLNEGWRSRGHPEIRIGIGLNHGEVFAGYLGSERRLEYTAIGDPVNVASRLCGEAKAGEILLSETTLARLSHRPAIERRPDVELRGKKQRVGVYRLIRE